MDNVRQVKIISDTNVADSIFWHKKISFGRRSFGLLIGNIIEQREASVVYVEDIYPMGKLSKAKDILAGSEWVDIRSKALKRYPGKDIVGWYGIRNGWGAMMLEEDQYIQKNHFTSSWQVMYLLDDKGGFRNFYTWEGDKLRQYKQDFQEEALQQLRESGSDDKEATSVRGGLPKWILAVFVVALLTAISYPRYIRPLIDDRGQAAHKEEPGDIDADGENPEPEVNDHADMEIEALKESILGLEDALEKKAQELEEQIEKLDAKNKELEEKEQEIEKLKETIKSQPDFENVQASSDMKVYQLSEGDTLSGISEKFYNTSKYSDTLGRLNRVTDHKVLRVGSYIIVPPKDVIDDIYTRNTASRE